MSFSDHQQQDVQIDTSEYDEYANGPFSFSEQELEMKDHHHQEDMYFSDQQQHGNGNRNSSLTILGQFDDDEDADGNGGGGGAMSKGKSWIQTLWFSLSIFFVVVATVMVRVFMFFWSYCRLWYVVSCFLRSPVVKTPFFAVCAVFLWWYL